MNSMVLTHRETLRRTFGPQQISPTSQQTRQRKVMKTHIRRLFLIPVLLLATLSVQDGGQSARAGSSEPTPPAPTSPSPPDFTNVSDILGGRRTLFPVDDLLVTYQNQNQTIFPISAYTSDGGIGNTNALSDCAFGSTVGYVSGIGRMFNLPYAVEVVVSGNNFVIVEMNAMNSQPCGTRWDFSNPVGATPAPNQFPQGDFTGDGFTDFAILLNGAPYIFTALDVNNVSAGVFWSDAGTPPFPATGFAALAAGDFDGDGDDEVAMISTPSDVSSCPASQPCINVTIYDAQVTSSNGQLQRIQLVNVGSMQFAAATSFNCVAGINVTAGAFSGAVNPTTGILQDQLLIAYQAGFEDQGVCLGDRLVLASVGATTQSTEPLALELSLADQLEVSPAGLDNISLTSARLDFFAPTEQVVLAAADVGDASSFAGNNSLSVLVMDDTLEIQVASTKNYAHTGVPLSNTFAQFGVAVGNFDQETGPDNPLALEIAALNWWGIIPTRNILTVVLFRVDPGNNFALSTPSSSAVVLLEGAPAVSNGAPATISSGDLQGRSLLLGEPTKLTVEHVQPRLVLGMPPMHVDWVTDVNGAGPEVLNLSAVLGTFYSSYESSDNTTVSSTSRNTTSWTQAVSTTISEGFSWGNAAEGSFSVTATESAGLMHDKTVAKQHDTYETSSFSVSAATGFDDSVWYSDERHNLYIYPVIGQTACPADNPDCSASEREPLTLILSGPDMIKTQKLGGSALEWFQPVWEPGNIFSYPPNLTQLKPQYPSVNLLTSSTPTEFATDNSTLKEDAKWTAGSTTSSTSGTTTNISWGTSLTVSTTPPKIEGGPSGSITASYNGSHAISTLNTSTTTLGESAGIGIVLPGTFPTPDAYQYGIMPFIFGNDPVSGTFQKIDLGTGIQTNGILHAAFTADPTDGGSWWQGAYTRPDLALNRPARWNVSTGTANTGPNCLETGNSGRPYSCATFNAPNTNDSELWNSEFFWMKGLLITPAAAPADGPQIIQAVAGDPVRLQARVYNYSLADMPAHGNVTVQFYAQPWDTSNNTPSGDSFLIQNVPIGPIPGFNSSTSNNAVAETTRLDTAAYADQHLIFWVLVVGRDGQGNPLVEMPGHGLTGIPPTVNSIAEAATWIEPYSNNLGYYHSVFYIAPNTAEAISAQASDAKAARTPAGKDGLDIKRFTVEPKVSLVNEKVSVSAVLHAGEQALDGVVVRFYDGDPQQGGILFDQEHITHIRANEVAEARVPFRAATCGVHTLYVETHPQTKTARTTLNVRRKPASGEQCGDSSARPGR
jgi:hypothetical protein